MFHLKCKLTHVAKNNLEFFIYFPTLLASTQFA